MTNYNPYLYILMRSDLASMNAGKLAAQACHAANQFVYEIQNDMTDHLHLQELYHKWSSSTEGGFGVTITLDVYDEETMINLVEQINRSNIDKNNFERLARVVHDPSYPVRDGQVTHLIPLNTCAYAFGDKNNETFKFILDDFDVYD